MLTSLQIFNSFFTGRVLPTGRNQIVSRQATYGSPVFIIGTLAFKLATRALVFINPISRPLPVPIPAPPLQLLSRRTDIHIPFGYIFKPVFAKHISPPEKHWGLVSKLAVEIVKQLCVAWTLNPDHDLLSKLFFMIILSHSGLLLSTN